MFLILDPHRAQAG